MLYKAEFNSPIGPLGLLADKEKILKALKYQIRDLEKLAS